MAKIADVAKIDKNLLKRIKRLVKNKYMNIRYSNVKQFVNIAVLEKLNKEEGGIKKEKLKC